MSNKNKKNSFFGGSSRNLIVGLVIVLVSVLTLTKFVEISRHTHTLTYSDFLKKIEAGEVKQVEINGQDVNGILKNNKPFETVVIQDSKNIELLKSHNVDVSVVSTSSPGNLWLISLIFSLIAGLALAAWFMYRQLRNVGSGGGGGGNIFNVGKSKARMYLPSAIKENFDSVAGAHEAKEELKDVVDFLKNPEKYRRLGAKITRGVLLVGEPGNGKTLLAKAVAGEATCPFFSISGSDFIEVFVGVGAARVRDLFVQARKHAPCIIFIDEIDAVGRHRGSGLGGGHDEREQTLNQLLTEMDGFATVTTTPVIVMAATNRPDVLDKALLRPGRFDRRVEVPYPDLISREEILRLHAKTVKLDPTVDLAVIARGTPGFTGADLANLINEAAILASKNNQDAATMDDFEESRDKVLVGKERKTMVMSPEEREVTAYHEAGHALLILNQPEEHDPLHKITILPRGSALGLTWWLPERDKYQQSKEEFLAQVKVGLGGRVAEEMVFNKVTSGAHNDFKKVTDIVRRMVCGMGMSDKLGPVIYGQGSLDYQYSQQTAQLIDDEVRSIIKKCYDEAKQLLTENRDKLDQLARALLEKETLSAEQVYALLGIPPRVSSVFK
jgi:cell division protease FtsH